jgi:hypothetical protein
VAVLQQGLKAEILAGHEGVVETEHVHGDGKNGIDQLGRIVAEIGCWIAGLAHIVVEGGGGRR